MSNISFQLNETQSLLNKAKQRLIDHASRISKIRIVRKLLFVTHQVMNWIPLSWTGLALIPVIIWIRQTYGIEQKDHVVLVATTLGLVVISILALVVVASSLRLKFWKLPESCTEPVEMVAGIPCQTNFQLPLMMRIPLIICQCRWVSPAGTTSQFNSRGFKLFEDATAVHRGYAETINRQFKVSDFLGLCKIKLTRNVKTSAIIEPFQGRAASPQLISQLRSGDTLPHPEGRPEGDLIEMKNYAAGDPLKLVLWKQYARTGRLIVRSPERSIAESQRLTVAFISGEMDEANAGVVFAMLDNQCFGSEFTFCADDAVAPTSLPSDAKLQVVQSAGSLNPTSSLSSIFQSESETNLLLFVPAKPGPWLERLAEQLDRRNVQAKAIIAFDNDSEETKQSWLSKVIFRGPKKTIRKQLKWHWAVRKQLQTLGIETTLIDRQNGEVVPLLDQ